MKARLSLTCLACMSVLLVSCGSKSAPTAPVELVDYVISGSADSTETGFGVDDEVNFYATGQFVGTSAGGVARFRARPGDILTVQAVDTCQGQYYLGALWIHRGQTAQQITPGVANCSVSTVPCIATVDCAAPDRIFLQMSYTLP